MDGRTVPVVQRRGMLIPLDTRHGDSLLELIVAGAELTARPDADPLVGARLAAPLRPPKIVAIGLNYLDHVRESNLTVPERPLVFTKFTTSVIGDGDRIEVDRSLTERVDWEVELAVVVGRRMRQVSVDDALGHVFGYTVANDVSARDLQFGDGQWVRGKSLDTFCPLGPAIVTADELPDPQALALRTRVNGETVQDSTTAEMVFGVAELLAFCSQSFTLEPGDVVLTGTPWGCGEFMDPPRSLRHGDVVEVEVEGIGVLRNEVVELASTRRTLINPGKKT
jgi:2-keto-4-pentenoate hydratase/2-oxohepta-3-ene-1,7-dioic acid hydratase in catechol pathway